MSQVVFGLVSDNGGGTVAFHWFRTADAMMHARAMGRYQSSPVQVLMFPNEMNLADVGFQFHDHEMPRTRNIDQSIQLKAIPVLVETV
jgi:hypothetical protein